MQNSYLEPTPQEIDAIIAQFSQRRYPQAESLARALTARLPQHGFGWKALGAVLKQLGRRKEALAPLAKAAQLLPHDAEAHYNLGTILLELGRPLDAANSYHNALAVNPEFLGAHFNLGNALQALGRLAEAETSYRSALRIQPNFAEAQASLAFTLMAQSRHAEAETAYRQALAIHPDFPEAHCHLGVLLRELDRTAEAEACHRRALQIRPDYPEAHNNLGNTLREQGRLDEAAACYRRALELKPGYAEAHYNLGNIFKDQCRYGEAEADYRRALELEPEFAKAHSNLGTVLKEQGRLDEAIIAYESAISIKPDFIESHYGLSSLKTYRAEDPHLAMLESQMERVAGLPLESQIRYWFALGKVREDLGRYDESFAAYHEGNRLQHAMLPVDEDAEEALLQRMLSTFTAEFFSERSPGLHVDDGGKSPIFIVGMPRSGTSLLEQILASVPGIHGAGELSDLSEVVSAAMPAADFGHFPEAVAGFSATDMRNLGDQYLERIWKHAPDALRITDKMPVNFFYIGMIHLMLPNAKIIHATRDPMDSCFSCYSRLFKQGSLSFTYDLSSLGRYFVRYSKLMRHWQTVLPAGTVLDMRYEDMVADTETQARRLLAYLGLPWDDRCLAFHQNKRRVATASAAQVRKPIYKTSMARWTRYRTHLAPLFEMVKNYR